MQGSLEKESAYSTPKMSKMGDVLTQSICFFKKFLSAKRNAIIISTFICNTSFWTNWHLLMGNYSDRKIQINTTANCTAQLHLQINSCV